MRMSGLRRNTEVAVKFTQTEQWTPTVHRGAPPKAQIPLSAPNEYNTNLKPILVGGAFGLFFYKLKQILGIILTTAVAIVLWLLDIKRTKSLNNRL